jgi:hypothetical protein
MARKGGVPKARVLNALDLPQFRAHLKARKDRRTAMQDRRPNPSKEKSRAMDSGRRESHTHKARTRELQELWAKVANQTLDRTGDEGRAIREANAVIARQQDD